MSSDGYPTLNFGWIENNYEIASYLRSTGGLTQISNSAAPSAGQTLIATSPTAATWQTPAVTPSSLYDVLGVGNTTLNRNIELGVGGNMYYQTGFFSISNPSGVAIDLATEILATIGVYRTGQGAGQTDTIDSITQAGEVPLNAGKEWIYWNASSTPITLACQAGDFINLPGDVDTAGTSVLIPGNSTVTFIYENDSSGPRTYWRGKTLTYLNAPAPTLASVLAVGNTAGGTDIISDEFISVAKQEGGEGILHPSTQIIAIAGSNITLDIDSSLWDYSITAATNVDTTDNRISLVQNALYMVTLQVRGTCAPFTVITPIKADIMHYDGSGTAVRASHENIFLIGATNWSLNASILIRTDGSGNDYVFGRITNGSGLITITANNYNLTAARIN